MLRGSNRGCEMPDATRIRDLLKMVPLPSEGGYFTETYRSGLMIPRSALPSSYPGERSVATAIYYLLTPDTVSTLHRLRGDEIFHFYLGDQVEMLELRADGTGGMVILGQDIEAGQLLQHVVPAGVWQGARLVEGGKFALLGTTVSPGFDYADYETGRREELAGRYPGFRDKIEVLTR